MNSLKHNDLENYKKLIEIIREKREDIKKREHGTFDDYIHSTDKKNSISTKEKEIKKLNITIEQVHTKFTNIQLLESIDISDIENFLRSKKLKRIKDNIKKK